MTVFHQQSFSCWVINSGDFVFDFHFFAFIFSKQHSKPPNMPFSDFFFAETVSQLKQMTSHNFEQIFLRQFFSNILYAIFPRNFSCNILRCFYFFCKFPATFPRDVFCCKFVSRKLCPHCTPNGLCPVACLALSPPPRPGGLCRSHMPRQGRLAWRVLRVPRHCGRDNIM